MEPITFGDLIGRPEAALVNFLQHGVAGKSELHREKPSVFVEFSFSLAPLSLVKCGDIEGVSLWMR